jgi:DNA-binding transcriptional LysR family regulator
MITTKTTLPKLRAGRVQTSRRERSFWSVSADDQAANEVFNFDWDATKYFYAIAKLGAFQRASRYLNISQSALTRKIQSLEDQIGAQLLNRQSRGVALTRIGAELFRRVEQNILSLREFGRVMRQPAPLRLRVAAPSEFLQYVLNDFLLGYSQKHADVCFETMAEERFHDLVMSDIDLAVRQTGRVEEGLCQVPLLSHRFKLFASEAYLIQNGSPASLEELRSHSLIDVENSRRVQQEETTLLPSCDVMPASRVPSKYQSSMIECNIKAAQHGLGILVAPEDLSIVKNSGLKPVLPHLTYATKDYTLVYPDFLMADTRIAEVIDALQTHFSGSFFQECT